MNRKHNAVNGSDFGYWQLKLNDIAFINIVSKDLISNFVNLKHTCIRTINVFVFK